MTAHFFWRLEKYTCNIAEQQPIAAWDDLGETMEDTFMVPFSQYKVSITLQGLSC